VIGEETCRLAQAGYDLRMQKARVTVTVRREILSKAERQVRRGRAKSVSAWVDAAMEEKARREDLTALLSAMKAENGPPSAKEEAWARAVLGL
jgi:Arc/MetJ-type ribon-helix-helix transcriptional regulator